MTRIITAETRWLEGTAAARLLDVPVKAIERLADDGLIGRRDLPGVRARFRRDDVDRLVRNGLVPARESASV